jgi:hypothetical protein
MQLRKRIKQYFNYRALKKAARRGDHAQCIMLLASTSVDPTNGATSNTVFLSIQNSPSIYQSANIKKACIQILLQYTAVWQVIDQDHRWYNYADLLPYIRSIKPEQITTNDIARISYILRYMHRQLEVGQVFQFCSNRVFWEYLRDNPARFTAIHGDRKNLKLVLEIIISLQNPPERDDNIFVLLHKWHCAAYKDSPFVRFLFDSMSLPYTSKHLQVILERVNCGDVNAPDPHERRMGFTIVHKLFQTNCTMRDKCKMLYLLLFKCDAKIEIISDNPFAVSPLDILIYEHTTTQEDHLFKFMAMKMLIEHGCSLLPYPSTQLDFAALLEASEMHIETFPCLDTGLPFKNAAKRKERFYALVDFMKLQFHFLIANKRIEGKTPPEFNDRNDPERTRKFYAIHAGMRINPVLQDILFFDASEALLKANDKHADNASVSLMDVTDDKNTLEYFKPKPGVSAVASTKPGVLYMLANLKYELRNQGARTKPEQQAFAKALDLRHVRHTLLRFIV